jgi:hypothetical protein
LNKLSSKEKETVRGRRADVLKVSHFGDELDAAWLTEEIFISRAMRVYVNFQCLPATITLLPSHLGTRVLWRRVNLTLAGGEVLLITLSMRGAVSTNPTSPTPYSTVSGALVPLPTRGPAEGFLTMCAAKSPSSVLRGSGSPNPACVRSVPSPQSRHSNCEDGVWAI